MVWEDGRREAPSYPIFHPNDLRPTPRERLTGSFTLWMRRDGATFNDHSCAVSCQPSAISCQPEDGPMSHNVLREKALRSVFAVITGGCGTVAEG